MTITPGVAPPSWFERLLTIKFALLLQAMFCNSLSVCVTRGALRRASLVHGIIPLSALQSLLPRSTSYLYCRQLQPRMSSSAVTGNDKLMLWTVDDYHDLIDTGLLDDRRIELIRGRLVKMAPQSPEHVNSVEFLFDTLSNALKNRAIVRDSKPITLRDSEPEPDIAIVSGSKNDYKKRHPTPRDIMLVAEVSKSIISKDDGYKLGLYATEGIQEFWIINLAHHNVRILKTLKGSGYSYDRIFSSGCIAPAVFPDCQVNVEEIF